MTNFFRIIFLSTIILLVIPHIAISATKDKASYLKLIVKTDVKIEKPIKDIMKKLDALSKEMEKTAKLYNTMNQKAYWEIEAKKSYVKLLQSEGYYNSIIESDLSPEENAIIFYVNGWERYKIKKIECKYCETSNKNIKIPDFAKLKIKEGDFAIAADILAAQHRLAKHIERENCLLTLEVTHEAIIDNADDTVLINFIINAGSEAKVKSVDIQGLTEVNPVYVRKLIPIENGQCFQRSLINEAQGSLQRSGLFAITNPLVPDHADKNGEVPLVFDLKERKHRSLKAGISYGTDLGAGATLGWDHRNFLGSGETVRSSLFANQKEQTLDINFAKPFFKRDDQTLKIDISAENLVSKAFNNKEGSLAVGLERQLSDIWTATVFGKYSYSIVKENKKSQNFAFLSAPFFLKRDTRDNLLDAHSGSEITMRAEPFRSLRKEQKSFLKNELSGTTYVSLGSKHAPVVAIRVYGGGISGAKLGNIPASERYYVGGAGSVRGYAYQLAGDVDSKKQPIGGRSFIQSSLEFRTELKDDLGLVAFIDTGNVFDSVNPKIQKKMFTGYGVGVRYFTGFGPLRVDIGFPTKRRQNVDRPFQLYFGIGQNF